jgi:hypothetical protein
VITKYHEYVPYADRLDKYQRHSLAGNHWNHRKRVAWFEITMAAIMFAVAAFNAIAAALAIPFLWIVVAMYLCVTGLMVKLAVQNGASPLGAYKNMRTRRAKTEHVKAYPLDGYAMARLQSNLEPEDWQRLLEELRSDKQTPFDAIVAKYCEDVTEIRVAIQTPKMPQARIEELADLRDELTKSIIDQITGIFTRRAELEAEAAQQRADEAEAERLAEEERKLMNDSFEAQKADGIAQMILSKHR